MQLRYDHQVDALYIQLTENQVAKSRQINPTVALDLDADGQVIGIEVLHVRKQGIDPLALEILHTSADAEVERPDPDAMQEGRKARMEALKKQRQQEMQDTP